MLSVRLSRASLSRQACRAIGEVEICVRFLRLRTRGLEHECVAENLGDLIRIGAKADSHLIGILPHDFRR